jgi:hypothetical protein
MLKIIIALFIGETLAIYGELLAAKGSPWIGSMVGLTGYPFLIFGYWYGYKIGGIWQVTATSLGTILIAEPILVLTMFSETPSRNALIGCILGALGLVIASVK